MKRTKTKYIIQGILWTLLVVFVLSCESEQRPEPIEADLPAVVSFSEHIIPILEGTSEGIILTGRGRACTDCHNGSIPPDLTSENAYIELSAGGFIDVGDPENSKLYQKIEESGSMYKYTNNVDIAYVLEWINQGALEN